MSYKLTVKNKPLQEEKTFNSGFTKREMVVTVPNDKDYSAIQRWLTQQY